MTNVLDVEYVTIGALMLAPAQLDEVGRWLTATDFARPLCRELYEVMVEMRAQRIPVDPVTVLDQVHRRGRVRPDAQPGPEILTMVQAVPTPTAAAFYGRLVLEDALFRSVEEVGTRLAQVGHDRRGRIEDAFEHAAGQQDVIARLRDRWAQAAPRLRPVPSDLAGRTRQPEDQAITREAHARAR